MSESELESSLKRFIAYTKDSFLSSDLTPFECSIGVFWHYTICISTTIISTYDAPAIG